MNNREREVRSIGLFSDGFKELKKASEPLYKAPKSIQETIEIMAVAENRIFEVAKNRYSNRDNKRWRDGDKEMHTI